MKSNELRLGNYVKSNINYCLKVDSGIVQLDETALYYLFNVDNDWDRLEPIPLTEEWLERFGFKEYRSPIDYAFGYKKGQILWVNEGQIRFIYDSLEYEEQTIIPHTSDNLFKHIHTLQNLYFALTGEELELKK